MRTTQKTATSARTSTSKSKSDDAIALLKADHAEVKKCFVAYEKLAKQEAPASERQELGETICALLTVHATIEEEIFYPASRQVLGDDAAMVDEADVEHASCKDLIAQIQASDPESDEHYDARVKVLGEYIDHHVKEEQDELFPKVKKAGLDIFAIGEELAIRKSELTNEIAASVK